MCTGLAVELLLMKLLHKIVKGVSLTGALFALEACYGTPEPFYECDEAPMTFQLLSKTTGAPLEGIHIKSSVHASRNFSSMEELGVTGADGTCRVVLTYYRNVEGPVIRFEDEAGNYAAKDTTLADLRDRTVEVKLNPAE